MFPFKSSKNSKNYLTCIRWTTFPRVPRASKASPLIDFKWGNNIRRSATVIKGVNRCRSGLWVTMKVCRWCWRWRSREASSLVPLGWSLDVNKARFCRTVTVMGVNKARLTAGFIVAGVLMVFFGTVLVFVGPIIIDDQVEKVSGTTEPPKYFEFI